MAGASRYHNAVKDNLIVEIGSRLKGSPCRTYSSDMRVLVSATGLYTYPDIVIVCGEPEFEDGVFDTLLNPQVIIEVLSDSTANYNSGMKFRHYERIESLKEYILVAQDEPAIERRVRQSRWDWLLTTITGLDAELELVTVPVEVRDGRHLRRRHVSGTAEAARRPATVTAKGNRMSDPLIPPLLTPDLPGIGGRIKVEPEDFEVEEIPAYEPAGTGDHLFLWIEKRDIGAEFFARGIARRLGIAPGEVGTAGLKDRRAVTRQWVSVPAAVESRLAELDGDGVRVLRVSRHGNKLRPGPSPRQSLPHPDPRRAAERRWIWPRRSSTASAAMGCRISTARSGSAATARPPASAWTCSTAAAAAAAIRFFASSPCRRRSRCCSTTTSAAG